MLNPIKDSKRTFNHEVGLLTFISIFQYITICNFSSLFHTIVRLASAMIFQILFYFNFHSQRRQFMPNCLFNVTQILKPELNETDFVVKF